MEKFNNLEELYKRVDELFDDVMVNRFHFKGDITKEKDVKKFLKIKKIRVYINYHDAKTMEHYCIEHKNKLKYIGIADTKEFVFTEVDINDLQDTNKV